MKIWIVVADQREALFYDAGTGAEGRDSPLSSDVPVAERARLVLKISYPQARADSERGADHSGRGLGGNPNQRRRSDGGRSSRRGDHEHFAARIGEEIDRARRGGRFDRLVLGASPSMLQLIRSRLSASSRALLAAEVTQAIPRAHEHALLEQLVPLLTPPPELRAGGHR